jgi:hypothetical protein
MDTAQRKLSLHRPATYEIRVPGHLDASWSAWTGEMKVALESEDDGAPVTVLTGVLDQAALHSLLRRLYSLGLPLISVYCADYGSEPSRH